jgi:hypothetical protein
VYGLNGVLTGVSRGDDRSSFPVAVSTGYLADVVMAGTTAAARHRSVLVVPQCDEAFDRSRRLRTAFARVAQAGSEQATAAW